MSLNFSKDVPGAAAKASGVDGIWLGALTIGAQSLRIQVSVASDPQGQEHCAVDSIDQGSFNMPCANAVYADRKFSFDLPAVHGHWDGELSSDQNTLTGTWNQGAPAALNFARQEKPWSPPPKKFDAAEAAVKAADMQSVMNRDLAEALNSGA